MNKKAIFFTVLGNALEWIDFASYAYFATIIAHQFFPTQDRSTALISTFAVFGVGLIARPLGAVFFGRLGDVHGRKAALMLAMPMMGLGTLLIGLMPTYEQVGIAAPICLVICRLLQGFSAGGEAGNAITFLIEWAPPKRRALYACLQQASGVFGTVFGSAVAAMLSTTMSHDALESFGWRILFLVGGAVIAPVAFYLRAKIDETPAFLAHQHIAPVKQKQRSTSTISVWLACFRAIGMTMVWIASYYVFLSYLPAFLSTHAQIPSSVALWVNTAGLLTMATSIVLSAAISDVIGRKPLLIAVALAFIVLPYPLFTFFLSGASAPLMVISLIVVGALVGVFAGVFPATMAEMFPTRLRSGSVSLAFGLATAVFGGFGSLISEALIKFTGSHLSPSYYVIFSALISLPIILSLKETAHQPLK
ncbi:MFS transporter [Paraburkholderia aromaticivorans]|uniref:MFS transporter n=1 Tax=Paraburkholderia aromaticivorans TaxID=2026199 RepID=UPI001455E386|nr:MFS transporter [Paraburkholderia aromaticivorans]